MARRKKTTTTTTEATAPDTTALAPSYVNWLRGDPQALAYVCDVLSASGALRDDRSIREAVATEQKRWGDNPTGYLSRAQFDRLVQQEDTTSTTQDTDTDTTQDTNDTQQDTTQGTTDDGSTTDG